MCEDGIQGVSGSFDESVRHWDLTSGTCLRTLTGHSGWVTSVAISADGRSAASGSADHTVRLWDLASGECIQTLNVGSFINAVAMSNSGRDVIVVVESGATIHYRLIWDLDFGDVKQ